MKRFLVVALIAGLLGGLAIYEMSGRQPRQANSEKRAPTPTRAATPPPPPANLRVATVDPKGPAPARPASPSREDQSWQLKLEIERSLMSMDDAQRDRAYRQLLPALIKLDPAAVKQLVANWPAGPGREELLHRAAHAWSTVSVDGAIEWAGAMKEDDERALAASEIVSQVAQGDPARAIGISDQFAIGRKDGSMEQMMQRWANTNLQESLSWAEGQPPGTQRDQILAPVAIVEAQTAPADAANTVLNQINVGPIQDNAIARVVQQWYVLDPDALSAWVEQLPKGHIQDVANAAAQSARQRALAAAGAP